MAVKIGLTGGIGSGKSAVAKCFAEVGIQVINADQIGHRLSQSGTVEFAQIIAQFGADILDATGQIERARLAKSVFASPQKRKLLESILHPPIRAEMHARAEQDEQCYCILEIPLLVESAQYREMARVITVSCLPALRIARLKQHRDMHSREIKRIMENQASEEERLAVADDVIDNNHAIEEIEPQVARLHQTYLNWFN